eukprot:TRINITY_DN14429_c2_g1_i1.p1 TRINITY_DN14429_c2_g1~~TRINITY_DN14429_c2_g1_i1.p1  ORF type:complete len:785 (-),score=211.13 TRINITY_DN14429_c2_g1_i1:120-2414(-)
MALCDVKRQEWNRAVETTTEILTRNPKNTKALYRRGVSRIGQGKLSDAQKDLAQVVELEPENSDARQKLAEIVRQQKSNRSEDRDQAEKLRGFLRGERLEDTVPITEDGGVRKFHSNENAPLFAPWIKRAWLQPNSGLAGAVTAHIVMKTPAGKEVWNTRKPPGSLAPPPSGPQMASQPKPAERPAMPARWVVDDAWGNVFKAWNAAGKTLQLHELGKFEVTKHCMGLSVEEAVQRCLKTWLSDSPARQEMYRSMPEDAKEEALRKQALQILGLPEEFCLEPSKDPNGTLSMEVELLDVCEFMDLEGDGKQLLQVIREGKRKLTGAPVAQDLSTVTAHFRVAKLLPNYSLKDTRLGLATSPDGLVLREDRTKDPVEFVVGEEVAAGEADFVPSCIGECLLLPPGGVSEGMHFEVILRDGVPIRDMEKSIHNAYADGKYDALPDTSGPVVVRIEVEKVVPAVSGPGASNWKGVESLKQERSRAEELEVLEEGRYWQKALKRWRRIIVWLEEILEGRRWKLQGGIAGGDSMYDLEWEDEKNDSGGKDKVTTAAKSLEVEECLPKLLEVEDDLIKQLKLDELIEWATAHVAIAVLLAKPEGDKTLSKQHARCTVQAALAGSIPKDVEIRGRSTLAARLLEEGASPEALEVLKQAQALDPQNSLLKDQAALATQKENDRKSMGAKEALKSLKQELNDSLEANDVAGLRLLLLEVDSLPLTWEAVSETAIGKEVGKCAKISDPSVADPAKAIISRLHRLAKAERPLWVR